MAFEAKVNRFQVSFPQGDTLKSPVITAEGYVCKLLSSVPFTRTIQFVRYYTVKIVENGVTTNSKFLIRSQTIDADKAHAEGGRNVHQECESEDVYFEANQEYPDLRIDEDLLPANSKEIIDDYIAIEIVDEELPLSTTDEYLMGLLLKSVVYQNNKTLGSNNSDNGEQAGTWGEWVTQNIGGCNDGKQQVRRTRTCQANLLCEDSNGQFARTEVIGDEISCQPELGTWGQWVERNIGDCNNGVQRIERTRTCNNGLKCRADNGDIVERETQDDTKSCQNNNVYDPPDVVNGVRTQRNKTAWSDSYSVDGQCYCDSSYDHGLNRISANTPVGSKKVTEICAEIKRKFGEGRRSGRSYFNDIQCGHGPANDARDETDCPGIADGNRYSGPRCFEKGSKWNLDRVY